MTEKERIQKQKELIEVIGKYFDKQGFQPIAGRVLGLLMVMDKEQYTFEEITEELNISKSSASNVLRNLEIRGSIEYTTIPGDRKKYYHIKRQKSIELIDDFQKRVLGVKDMLGSILELKANKDSGNSIMFKGMIDMIEFYMMKMAPLKEKFRKG